MLTKRFYNKIIIRNYSPRGANPGINRQIKVLKNELSQEYINDIEGFGDIESDFMNVDQSHKQYENELSSHHDMVQKKIIKQKYFKQKLPNFLTYAEKEQIKLLYNRDPEEWTVEKLSESFPASLEVIKKIVKNTWLPKNEKRIIKHDESVIENWRLLKIGKHPQLHPDLVEHIKKFTNRTKEDLKNIKIDWDIHPLLPKPKNNEFVSIITSCKPNLPKILSNKEEKLDTKAINYKNPFSNNNMKNTGHVENDDETYLIDKIKDKRPFRYQDLVKNKVLFLQKSTDSKISNNNLLSDCMDESILNVEHEFSSESPNNNIESINIQKFDSNEIVISKEDMKKFNVSPIKARIHIPRKLWKKGATYKVQDCYYDYDGEFLYRIPGMTAT